MKRYDAGTVKDYLSNYGIVPDGSEPEFSLQRYVIIINGAARWFGPMLGQFLADCFMPVGKPVAPGYEDSIDRYAFEYPSDEDLEDFVSRQFPPRRSRRSDHRLLSDRLF